jgi:hypothetical protein
MAAGLDRLHRAAARRRQKAAEDRGEQAGGGLRPRSPVQGLAWQASLEGKDSAAGFPHADVLGRGKAPLAQVADHADQTQLVIDGLPGSWHQLDDELLTASGTAKVERDSPCSVSSVTHTRSTPASRATTPKSRRSG